MKKYTVKPGDTLVSLSQRTGVRVPLLLAANPQLDEEGSLELGQTLFIPELGKPAKQRVPSAEEAASGDGALYFGFVWPHTVQADETWTNIARQYNVTVDDILQVNPHYQEREKPPKKKIIYIPSVGMKKKKASKQAASETAQEGDEQEGPHTHQPYRTKETTPWFRYDVSHGSQTGSDNGSNWHGELEESSIFMSSWNQWDGMTRQGRTPQDGTDGTGDISGWSSTQTFRVDS